MPLRDYQVAHYEALLRTLVKTRSALDASDTGTGKTYVALEIARALGVVPLVICSLNGRGSWEKASEATGIPVQFVNYEKLRGYRHWQLAKYPFYVPYVEGEDFADAKKIPFYGPYRERGPAQSDWLIEQPWGKGSFMKWKQSYELVIFDEGHRCAGATSLNSKGMIAAKRQCRYNLVLSATAADDPRQMKALGYMLGIHGLSKKEPITYMNWLLKHGCTPGTFGGFDLTVKEARLRKAFTKMNAEVFPAHGSRMRKDQIPGFPKSTLDFLFLTPDDEMTKKLAAELHEMNERDAPAIEMTQGIRQKLEHKKIPQLIDAAKDYALTSKLVFFMNFTKPLFELYEELQGVFGHDRIGYISGTQQGEQGFQERKSFLERFQANQLDALVVNAQAGGESADMHDPKGEVERTTIISPLESGRQLKQVLGRTHRDGGAFSLQLIALFKGTYEEKVADRMRQKSMNIDLFNDADLSV